MLVFYDFEFVLLKFVFEFRAKKESKMKCDAKSRLKNLRNENYVYNFRKIAGAIWVGIILYIKDLQLKIGCVYN